MSYQSTYRSVSSPIHSYSSSPQPSIQRKPANYSISNRSISPLPNGTGSVQATNKLYSPTATKPLNSFPPQPISPSITPPIVSSAYTSVTQPLSASPTSTNGVLSNEQYPANSALKPLTAQEIDEALGACLNVQETAVTEHSKRPFGALLLGPDNKTVKYLEKCTLVSTWEPCAMCAGTIYWTGIGRLLYAVAETRLKELTGTNNEENMTMSLPCRVVFEAGQRKTEVIGPVLSWEQKVVDSSGKWWKEHTADQLNISKKENVVKDNASVYSHRTSVSIYNPNDSLLGSIGEDGEYQADLKIDWMP